MHQRAAFFQVRYWREWLVVFLFVQLFLIAFDVCVFLLMILFVKAVNWSAVIVWWSLGAGFALVVTFAKAWRNNQRFWVVIGPDAIEGFDWRGYRVAIGWDEVKSVHRRWYWNPYLTITSQVHQNTIWLPLHLVNFPEFVETVAEYAGSDHPLTVALYAEGDFD